MKEDIKAPNPEFKGLLNSKNIALWEYLSQKYEFRLEESRENGYLTYFDNTSIVIEVDMADFTPSSFTHELLHVFVKDQGLHINWNLRMKITADEDLLKLFSTSLRVHMGNCLEHVKMLPLFLQFGFSNESFIGDYNRRIIDEVEIRNLEEIYFRADRPQLKAVDLYLGKFFSMKASNNPSYDYSSYYKRLEKIDESLFEINEALWESWAHYRTNSETDYQDLIDRYLSDMKAWKKEFFDH